MNVKNNNGFEEFFTALVAARRRRYKRDMVCMFLIPPVLIVLGKLSEYLGNKSFSHSIFLIMMLGFVIFMALVVKTIVSGLRRRATITFEGQTCRLFMGYGEHYPKGSRSVSSWPQLSMVVADGGVGYYNFFNFEYWIYPVDTIENIVIGKKKCFIRTYPLITVVPKQGSSEGAITYHPRAFEKAIAALEECGCGDKIINDVE